MITKNFKFDSNQCFYLCHSLPFIHYEAAFTQTVKEHSILQIILHIYIQPLRSTCDEACVMSLHTLTHTLGLGVNCANSDSFQALQATEKKYTELLSLTIILACGQTIYTFLRLGGFYPKTYSTSATLQYLQQHFHQNQTIYHLSTFNHSPITKRWYNCHSVSHAKAAGLTPFIGKG